jgi:tetratricopeptide (TPR) repeat protein
LKRYPELIRYTVDTVVNEILNEGYGTLCRSRDFLQHLVYSDIYISVILLLEITSRLIESEQEETVRQFINLLEPTHPYCQQIKLIVDLQKSSLEIYSNEIFKQIGYALKEKGIPEILKGILQCYLSEYFYLSRKYRMAERSGEQALRNLSPAISFNHWMKSQFSICRLEITFGNLSDALARLSVLQKVAEASNSTNHLAIVYEIRGQIHYEYGQYIEAKNCFQESLELLKGNNQSFETIKVLNSLDLVEIKLSVNKN